MRRNPRVTLLCRIQPAHVVALDAAGPALRDPENGKHVTSAAGIAGSIWQ